MSRVDDREPSSSNGDGVGVESPAPVPVEGLGEDLPTSEAAAAEPGQTPDAGAREAAGVEADGRWEDPVELHGTEAGAPIAIFEDTVTERWAEDHGDTPGGSRGPAGPPAFRSRTAKREIDRTRPIPMEEREDIAGRPPRRGARPSRARTRDEPRRSAMASSNAPNARPEGRRTTVELSRGRALPWVIAGAALTVAAFVVLRDVTETRDDGMRTAATGAPPERERMPTEPHRAPSLADPPALPSGSAPPEGAATTRRDPREPPPGTPPEIAAVFRRLPLGPVDEPPVGGVGRSGVHVDTIRMGNAYDRWCDGPTDTFSVSRGDQVNVCVRVVHPREKEEVVVLWQKDGGTVRRGTMSVKPMHAYRTRAYLVLRREYVGRWTVRILSQDDVELASQAFTVVE